jgi:alpha-amylase
MVKGYSASFTADYNTTAQPTFSVGEYWDGSSAIKNWINGTKVNATPTSAAFDFQFRYRVRDAINQNNWTNLADNTNDTNGRPLIYDSNYRQYAVTFVENHDTEKRANSNQDPIKGDTLAANAFMLAMPGTPCVFLKHWIAKKSEIKRMISARKLAGINNLSTYEQKASEQLYYAVATTGTKGTLICTVGKTPTAYNAPAGYTKIISGSDYIYYISDALVSEWNTIENEIIEEEKKELEEEENDFTPYSVTIYVRNENDWNKMNFYIWDSSNTQLNGNWPGKQITETVTLNGYTWYKQSFTITSSEYCVNAVFSTSSGSPQTVDVTDITTDKYYVISSSKIQTKYMVNDMTETVGIKDVSNDLNTDSRIYNLMGQEIQKPIKGQVYIQGGKKILSH